jgi:hypothetical protein
VIKWTLGLALSFVTLTSQAQVVAADTSASVTVTINGKTYTGLLPITLATPVTNTANDTNLVLPGTASRPTANLPVAPALVPPTLPAQMMTAAWPLNQSALQYPDETRSLNSSYGDGQFTPKPIASTFQAVFGTNHIAFDTSMPWVVIDSNQTPDVFATVLINHPEWGSDDGQTCSAMSQQAVASTHWPVIPGIIEGANNPTGDRHMLVVDVASSRLYELFGVNIANAGTASAIYSADAARCWDVSQPSQGLPGQNSADAAGLPILPLLLRFDEANAGVINHALRFTVNLTRANANGGVFSAPASHAAGNNWSSMAYMGMRLRLRSDFDTKPYSAINQAIAQAMKTYGIVVADNGLTGLVTSDNDARWNADDLHMLSLSLTLNDFVPVNSGQIIDSTGAPAQ